VERQVDTAFDHELHGMADVDAGTVADQLEAGEGGLGRQQLGLVLAVVDAHDVALRAGAGQQQQIR
jgi:hypothetical protein